MLRAKLGDGAAAAGGGPGELAASAEPPPKPRPGPVPVSSAWRGLPAAAGAATPLSACCSEPCSAEVSGEALVAGCGRGAAGAELVRGAESPVDRGRTALGCSAASGGDCNSGTHSEASVLFSTVAACELKYCCLCLSPLPFLLNPAAVFF